MFSLLAFLILGVPNDPSVLTLPPDNKTAWMQALSHCESNASTTIKTWDINNEWSIGKYQYQYATWLTYSKKFGTKRENITDGNLQDEVTRYILDNGGEGNWFNCSKYANKKVGLYGELLPRKMNGQPPSELSDVFLNTLSLREVYN